MAEIERLTIDEIIDHCERKVKNIEKVFRKEHLELEQDKCFISNVTYKEYWEHRQIASYLKEFKILKEKNTPKKPNQVSRAMDKDQFVGLIGFCPTCGSIVAEDNFVCEDCFQVLDWCEV